MRRLITWLAMLACGAASTAAVVRVVRTEWHGSPVFDHADLENWLVARESADVVQDRTTQEPPLGEVRRAAWLLERDFALRYDWEPYYKSLDEASRSTFRKRWGMLVGELFLQRSRQFATPMLEREAFLTTQLATLQTWYAFDRRGRRVSGPALLMDADYFGAAVDRADPAAGKNLLAFRDALGRFAAERLLRRFMPDEPPDGEQNRADE